MLRYFVIFMLLFVIFSELKSENVFPMNITNIKEIGSGISLIADSGDSSVIYNLFYDFAKGNENINVSNLKTGNSKKGLIISNSKIIAYSLFKSDLIFISRESDGIYFSMLGTDAKRTNRKKIRDNIQMSDDGNCQLIQLVEDAEYLLGLYGELYKIIISDSEAEIIFLSNISGNLLQLDNSSGFNIVEYGIIEESGNGIILNFFDYNSELLFSSKLVSFENGRWLDLGITLAYLSSPANSQTFIQIIDKKNGQILSNFWIDAETDLVNLESSETMIIASYITASNEGYNICKSYINLTNPRLNPTTIKLPDNVFNPLKMDKIGGEYFLINGNSIIIFDENLSILSSQFYPFDKKIHRIENIINLDDDTYIIAVPESLKFTKSENKYWQLKKIYAEIKNYLLPIILVIILIVFIQLYRHQKRLVNELLDLSNIGLLFVVDSGGRLINLNNLAKNFLEINNSIPLRRYFAYYVKNEKTKPIADIIDQTLEKKESIKQKITIKIDNNDTEWLCTTIPLRNITGMFRGVVLSAIDITEQLERKRLSNWAQLAHDMQTNLSTIKLNAEHLDIEMSENNQKRQNRIIFQVNLLMQRVRDIVTVGRNENLNIEQYSIPEICSDVRKEFDDLMFPNVEFEINCKNILFYCDKPKLIRALRNAVENGIKAMKGQPGKIKISASSDKGYVSIKIEDTGAGMDADTQKKMMIPYFTTAGKSGGSGIGTMIMQHVTELHGGFLVVNSEKGKGTEVIFNIPLAISSKKDKII